MSIDHHDELIQGELDGTNTAEQSDALHTRLEGNPIARADFDRMRGIVHAMEHDGLREAPDGIVERIMASIPFSHHRAYRASYRQESGMFGWLQTVFARPALRFAGAFGIGLVAGAVAWSLVAKQQPGKGIEQTLDISQISGTMKSVSSAPGYARVGALKVHLEGVEGTFQLHQNDSNETLLAEVELHSETPIEWVIEYDAHEADLEGFRRYSGGGGSLVATDSPTRSQARTSHEGDGRYLLLFSTPRALEAPMTVRIFSSDELVYEENIAGTQGR